MTTKTPKPIRIISNFEVHGPKGTQNLPPEKKEERSDETPKQSN